MTQVVLENRFASATAQTRARYNRIAPFYDQIEAMSENKFKLWRERLWTQVRGKVLEVGVGTGKNLAFYHRDARVTAIDLSGEMLMRARARSTRLGVPVALREEDVQCLSFADNSFDTAVATFVFCSVPDPIQGLRELNRVLKPGGKLLLLEHVRIDKPVIGPVMDLIAPLVVRVMGANINRRTVENVKRAGLMIEQVQDLGPMQMVKLIVAHPNK